MTSLFLVCTPLLRLVYLDWDAAQLVFFGLRVPAEQIYLLVIGVLLLFGAVVFLTARFGRVLCAYACPVHFFLEIRLHRKLGWLVAGLSLLMPLVISTSLICFALPLERQLEIYRTQPFPQPLLAVHGLLLFVFFCVFAVYRERACKKACPYCILQNLTRTGGTAAMRFDRAAGRCIDCGACDQACPYRLNVRAEGDGDFCSNCCRCSVACRRVLGPGREVLNLTAAPSATPEPEEESHAESSG